MDLYGDYDDSVYDDDYGMQCENDDYRVKSEEDMSEEVQCEHKDTMQEGGMTVCTYCAKVLGESQIVSITSFNQDGRLMGKKHNKRKRGSTKIIGGHGSRRLKSSRDINTIRPETIKLYERRIENIADVILDSGMDLQSICCSAKYFYKIARCCNIVYGYSTDLVAGACLYLGIRVQKRPPPILLLDISHELRVDVFDIAAVFMKIARMCHIHGKDLHFGSKEEKCILATSLKIFKKMRDDWLNVGRRTCGVCGACLFIAAKIHNRPRSMHDIIKVVRVGFSTLETRLNEFVRTKASRLTVEDWEHGKQNKLTPHYPPSFVRNRISEKILAAAEKNDPVKPPDKNTSLKRKAVNLTENRPSKIQKICEADNDSLFDDEIVSEEDSDNKSQQADTLSMVLNDDEDSYDMDELAKHAEKVCNIITNMDNEESDANVGDAETKSDSQNENSGTEESLSEFETDDEITNMVTHDDDLIEMRETCFDLLYPEFDALVEKRELKKAENAKKAKEEADKAKGSSRRISKTVAQMRAQMMGSEMQKLEILIKEREKREPSPVYDPFGIRELNDVDPLDDLDDDFLDDVESVCGTLDLKCKDEKDRLVSDSAYIKYLDKDTNYRNNGVVNTKNENNKPKDEKEYITVNKNREVLKLRMMHEIKNL